MNRILNRIQDWYKINCNGDWEHSYGYKIETLDNPGWFVRIDLNETSLEKLQFNREYQNAVNENDWFLIRTKEMKLEILCGPENLEQSFKIFFDEIIPQYSNPEYLYEIYLPLKGFDIAIWTPAKAKVLNESTLQIEEIKDIDYKNIKVKNVDFITFNQSDLDKIKTTYKVGDKVKVRLENVFDGIILTTNE